MDEKQKYIEAWTLILEGLFPELSEQERTRRVHEVAEKKFGSTKSPKTEKPE